MKTPNAVSWFEIYVQDMPKAVKFYQSVFDVKLDDAKMDDVEMFFFPMALEGHGAPGSLIKVDGLASGQGGTTVYFGCSDCAVEYSKALANGGSEMRPKMSIGEHGFIAVFKDPDGNVIGLHSDE